jgi:hypothetical protein
MDTGGTASVAAMLWWPRQYMHVQSMLFSISNDNWVYAAVPIVACLVLVHLLFRHLFSIAWLSFKMFLSLLLYVQFRDLIASFVGQDPLSIEHSVLGIPSGTIQLTKSIGMQLVKTRLLANLVAVCPSCFPELLEDPIPSTDDGLPNKTEDEKSQRQGDSVDEEHVLLFSWVDMVRDLIAI